MPQLMRTSNPALTDQAFRGERAAFGEQAMTVKGTVNKTGILLLCAVATAAWTWNIFLHTHSPEAVGPLALVGVIGGLIFAIATISRRPGLRSPRRSTHCARVSCSEAFPLFWNYASRELPSKR